MSINFKKIGKKIAAWWRKARKDPVVRVSLAWLIAQATPRRLDESVNSYKARLLEHLDRQKWIDDKTRQKISDEIMRADLDNLILDMIL